MAYVYKNLGYCVINHDNGRGSEMQQDVCIHWKPEYRHHNSPDWHRLNLPNRLQGADSRFNISDRVVVQIIIRVCKRNTNLQDEMAYHFNSYSAIYPLHLSPNCRYDIWYVSAKFSSQDRNHWIVPGVMWCVNWTYPTHADCYPSVFF